MENLLDNSRVWAQFREREREMIQPEVHNHRSIISLVSEFRYHLVGFSLASILFSFLFFSLLLFVFPILHMRFFFLDLIPMQWNETWHAVQLRNWIMDFKSTLNNSINLDMLIK